MVDSLVLAITIIVVAVPEGLPLAVTLSLAYSVVRMKEQNNFVRHLRACETMGAATTVLTDKTGTLTLNKMTVTKAYLMDKDVTIPQAYELRNLDKLFLSENIARNTNASLNIQGDKIEHVGNRTECAMLNMVR